MEVLISVKFYAQTCVHVGCGVVFALTVEHNKRLRETHNAFYCPNGHKQWYNAKSEAEKLREQLERAKNDAFVAA